MARLIYSMLQSLDGYTEDAGGDFRWAAPDEEVHAYVNDLATSVGTYLYGRKMYETMVYWETALEQPDVPPVAEAWARQWQAAEKIVYSRTLSDEQSARTRIERDFNPEAIRRLKATSARDLAVTGPELAAHAIRAGLVDEFQLVVFPVVVGSGKRFFPSDARLDLELIAERHFAKSGAVVLRYRPRN
mgnify:CR=1 FL=1